MAKKKKKEGGMKSALERALERAKSMGDDENDDDAPEESKTETVETASASEVAELQEKLARAHADMQNIHRVTQLQIAESRKVALSEFVADVLPTLDNFKRALDFSEQSDKNTLVQGLQMVLTQIDQVFGRNGITQVAPMDQAFDPKEHEAIEQIENKDVPDMTVLEVMEAGYKLGDRIIRPAKVKVSTGGPARPAEDLETVSEAEEA